MTFDLREASDRNLIGAFAAVIPHVGLGGDVREFDGATAVFSGVASTFFNPVFALRARVAVADVAAAVEWIRSRGREPSVQVRQDLDGALASGIRGLGLVADPWATPGLVLRPIPTVVPPPPAGLRIEAFGAPLPESPGSVTRLDEWHDVARTSPVFRQVLPASTLGDPNMVFAIGYDPEGGVCQALAVRTDDLIGIYAVGSIERARRRGFGTAITWAAIDAGRRAWGCETAVLQSSAMGLGVYQQMGFLEVCRYVEYERPPIATEVEATS